MGDTGIIVVQLHACEYLNGILGDASTLNGIVTLFALEVGLTLQHMCCFVLGAINYALTRWEWSRGMLKVLGQRKSEWECFHTWRLKLMLPSCRRLTFHRMQRLGVGDVKGSPSQRRKAGVILINKCLHYTSSNVVKDQEGRKASAWLISPTMDIRVIAVYAPYSPTKAFFRIEPHG